VKHAQGQLQLIPKQLVITRGALRKRLQKCLDAIYRRINSGGRSLEEGDSKGFQDPPVKVVKECQ